jgi:hypothetical protein
MYPQYQSQPPILLIIFIILCSLVVIAIFYLIIRNRNNSSSSYRTGAPTLQTATPLSPHQRRSIAINNALAESTSSMSINGTGLPSAASSTAAPEVFHVKNNIFSYADAPAVCKLFGAELASLEQLQSAQKRGADWCSGGWTKEGLVAYPIQQATFDKLQENEPHARHICGTPGINLLRNEHDLLYGVTCYGQKRPPIGIEKVKTTILSDKDIALKQKMEKIKHLDLKLTPWDNNAWTSTS